MARVPNDFQTEFENKGETFFEIAELLYTDPSREYTQQELVREVDVAQSRVSEHLNTMEEWVCEEKNQQTYRWNLEKSDPFNTGLVEAVSWFYSDFRGLVGRHSQRTTGVLAMVGFFFFITAITNLLIYLLYQLPITPQSELPPFVYLFIALGFILSGIIATVLAPVWAIGHRLFQRVMG